MRPLTLAMNLDEKDRLDKEMDFSFIFETYYKRIYNYIYYRVNSHHTSEDLVSLVFEKAMLNIGKYSANKSPFEVWLFAIARNVVNDYYRSLKRRTFFSIETVKGLLSKEKTPEDTMMLAERNDQLSKALARLTSKERNMIALKYGANLKNDEIANLLGISESNAGVILYRTMKKLKKEMEMNNNGEME